MTAPTTPFSTTKQIAYLLLGLFQTQATITDPDFTPSVTPSLTVITGLQTMKSAELQMDFASVGYKIPFQEISGESWPTHQTNFLALLEAMAVAGQVPYSILPAPGMAVGKGPGVPTSIYRDLYKEWRDRILESGCGLRAQYYPMSKAEKWIADPRGPQTDYSMSSDTRDPAKFGLLLENLKYLEDQYNDIAGMQLDWDYLYSIRKDT